MPNTSRIQDANLDVRTLPIFPWRRRFRLLSMAGEVNVAILLGFHGPICFAREAYQGSNCDRSVLLMYSFTEMTYQKLPTTD